MDKLIHTNRIEPANLDQIFGLPAGFTSNMMQDVTACNVPKKIVGQYLKYGFVNYVIQLAIALAVMVAVL